MGSNNVGEICKELHLVDANKSLIEVFLLDEGVSNNLRRSGLATWMHVFFF